MSGETIPVADVVRIVESLRRWDCGCPEARICSMSCGDRREERESICDMILEEIAATSGEVADALFRAEFGTDAVDIDEVQP